jgi:hypothetical protein
VDSSDGLMAALPPGIADESMGMDEFHSATTTCPYSVHRDPIFLCVLCLRRVSRHDYIGSRLRQREQQTAALFRPVRVPVVRIWERNNGSAGVAPMD